MSLYAHNVEFKTEITLMYNSDIILIRVFVHVNISIFLFLAHHMTENHMQNGTCMCTNLNALMYGLKIVYP